MDDLQQFMRLLGAAMAIAALGTFILSIPSRWVGVWTILLAILAAMLLAYQPLIGASLFAGLKTDPMRRALVGAIPFTLVLAGLSFKGVPTFARVAFALIGPALLLCFVFAHYPAFKPELPLAKIIYVSLAVFAGWMLVEPVAVRSPGVATPLVIGCVTGPAAYQLIDSVQQQAGNMSPMLPATAAGALAAAVIFALMKKPLSFARGPVLLWLALMGAMYSLLWIDSDLPMNHLCCIAAVPVLAWICEIPVIHRLKPWKRELIRFALMLIPAIIVSVPILKEMQQNGI